MTRAAAAVLVALACLCVAPAAAQDAVPAVPEVELPEPRLLREGERAPFTGQLMAQDDVLMWARTIEDLRHRLELDVRTERERCDVRLELERARTTAAGETLALHDTLWTDRVAELTAAAAEARRSAERQWYESPVLWFAIGAVVATGVLVAIVASD